MKLTPLLLLVAAAIAATIPTPANDSAMAPSKATPPASAPLVLDPSVDPASPDLGHLVDPQEVFWDYNLTIKESYMNGELKATANFDCPGGHRQFDFDENEQSYMWAKVTDKYLWIYYNHSKHQTTFAYDGWHWGQDNLSANLPGYCEDFGGWNRGPMEYPKDKSETRTINVVCFIKLGIPTAGMAKLDHMVAPRTVSRTDSTSSVTTGTHNSTPMSPATGNGTPQLFGFLMGVTEYCESSEGAPLKARGYWQLAGASDGALVSFPDGNTLTAFSLNTGKQLNVGPYDFYTNRVGFSYGDCHWDQDNAGPNDCGFCYPGNWSSGEINCAINAAASRSHGLQCYFAVQNSAAANTQPEVIAARANDPEIPPVTDPVADTSAAQKTTLLYSMYMTEQCVDGKPLVRGRFTTGQFNFDFSFPPGLINGVYALPEFPYVEVGPFDYREDRLRFAYHSEDISCEWYDYETWKKCAEFRARVWVGGDVDCANDGGRRTKDIDCSLIMRN